MPDEPLSTETLLACAAGGDGGAWGTLLMAHRERLERMVAFRMDARLRGRVDAADVVQEALVEATAHRADYFRAPAAPLFLWLRVVVANKLAEMRRRHLSARMRDARREQPLEAPP